MFWDFHDISVLHTTHSEGRTKPINGKDLPMLNFRDEFLVSRSLYSSDLNFSELNLFKKCKDCKAVRNSVYFRKIAPVTISITWIHRAAINTLISSDIVWIGILVEQGPITNKKYFL